MAGELTHFFRLNDEDLRGLAGALRSARLNPPFRSITLQRFVANATSEALATELQSLHENGLNVSQIALLIDVLLEDRSHRPRPEDAFDLVTTDPKSSASNRDTSVVVRELFAGAEASVLVAGYAVYQGRRVFQTLAEQMKIKPNLNVRLVLDIRRNPGDTSAASEVVHRFGHHFRQHDWPEDRPIPELFYFPSSLEEHVEDRGAMHAKTIVIDNARVFISSANFTEAAHARNVEVGLVVRSGALAEQLTNYFNSMIADGSLKPVFDASARELK